MNARGRILIAASSIDTFELKTGQTVPVGYYLNELAIPARKAVDAGYEIVLGAPKGNRPVVAAKVAAANRQHAGYRMTIFSSNEEKYAEDILLEGAKVPFYPTTALELAGARVETGEFFKPRVVQDRELITGQNPPSDHAIADLFVKALDRCSAKAAA